MADDRVYDTNTTADGQHVDEKGTSDATKGAELGGVGGAVTGGIAGSMAGPVGTVVGAVIGGVAGALGSGAAVKAVDRVDNDNTVSGVGHGTVHDDLADAEDTIHNDASYAANRVENAVPGNRVPGIQTGGYANDGTPDTRGIMEKTADAVTGDDIDDKTGRVVDHP